MTAEQRDFANWQAQVSLVGESFAFKRVLNRIPMIANSDATVLVEGESGTGKEGIANAIHICSNRPGPFVPMNCGAIPAELFERELFGHRRAAFTGAVSSEIGLVQAAQHGTLFLDEVDALPAPAQTKLLRLIQEKQYRPLGGATLQYADIRVVAATNANLERAIKVGAFRQDLFYRLAVLLIAVPPLRDRHGDTALLAEHFLAGSSGRPGRPHKKLTPTALSMLNAHHWPGNVRELQHVIDRAVAMSGDRRVIDGGDIEILGAQEGSPQSFGEAKKRAVTAFERAYLEGLLASHDGNIARAARTAKKNRRALWELLRKHSIDAKRFRRFGRDPQDSPPSVVRSRSGHDC